MTISAFPLILAVILGGILLAAAMLIAVLLIKSGRRGRIVNDHPICRACRFDLYNLPADRTVCPECGADITKPRSILPGHREPFRVRLTIGWALLGIIVLLAAMAGKAFLQSSESIALKPDWWLSIEGRYASVPTQRLAWKELARRAAAGGLSDDRVSSLADYVLAWQGNLTRPWLVEAGDFIEEARERTQLSDDRWKRYAWQAPQLSLVVRNQVTPDAKTLPAEIIFGKARTGDNSKLVLRSTNGLATGDLIRVLSEDERNSGRSGMTLSSNSAGSDDVPVRLNTTAMKIAAPGKRTVNVDLALQICEGWDEDAPPLITESRTFQATWELLGRDAATITILPDDSAAIRAQVEKAIRVQSFHRKPHGMIDVELHFEKLPVPLAHQAIIRAGEREWKPFTVRVLPTATAAIYSYGAPAKGFDAERVDIILEPSESAAMETTGMTQLWSGTIVIHDVAVTSDPPTTARSVSR